MAGAKNHQYHILPPEHLAAGRLRLGADDVRRAGAVHARQSDRHLSDARRPARHRLHHVQLVGRRVREAHGGDHTPVVQLHLRYGMILFIASEVMFFVAWFWAYFDFSLFPSTVEAVGGTGRPRASKRARSVRLPLLNTLILLCSGTHRHLGAPCADPRRPRRAEEGPLADDRARPAVHQHPGLRICPRAVRLRRATSTARPSSWRPASTASTSSSARSS